MDYITPVHLDICLPPSPSFIELAFDVTLRGNLRRVGIGGLLRNVEMYLEQELLAQGSVSMCRK
jgi:hypothetical protein